jgi:proteasome lid subunit RPN8/RPN11
MKPMMLTKKIIKWGLAQFDYEIRRIPTRKEERPGFTLYKYLKSDGTFDYAQYRNIQEEGNKRKIANIWVVEENIAFLADYIRAVVGKPHFGICHGTRRGKEQEWFRKYLGCEVIGTEIADTAEQFPYTIQWDFHETKPEWISAADFIYSNSFDHSYDPEKCLNAWMSCVKKSGICILEHSPEHNTPAVSELDPFGADIVQMPYLITAWGKGRYGVRELVSAPKRKAFQEYLYFIIVQRF